MKCLELSLCFRCLNRCVFCSNSVRMERFADDPLTREEIEDILAAKRREGYGVVTFNGGEPTLYPRFWEVLRRAKDLGYRTQLVTSGGALGLSAFARRALPFLDEVCVSLHGDTAAAHDGLTRNDRSFATIRAALREMGRSRRPVSVTINVVVTRRNVGRLVKLARLACSRSKVRQFWVSTLIPEGRALENYARLAVPWRQVLRSLPEIVAMARSRDVTVRLFGFPLCVLGAYRGMASELHKEPGVAVTRAEGDGAGPVVSETDEPEGPTRVKTARCAGCRLDGLCRGAWEEYVKLFGDGELEAVRS